MKGIIKGALPTSTPASTPSDTFVFRKLQKSMEEPVHNLLDDAGLDLLVEGVEGEVDGRVHDVKCGVEVVSLFPSGSGICGCATNIVAAPCASDRLV